MPSLSTAISISTTAAFLLCWLATPCSSEKLGLSLPTGSIVFSGISEKTLSAVRAAPRGTVSIELSAAAMKPRAKMTTPT